MTGKKERKNERRNERRKAKGHGVLIKWHCHNCHNNVPHAKCPITAAACRTGCGCGHRRAQSEPDKLATSRWMLLLLLPPEVGHSDVAGRQRVCCVGVWQVRQASLISPRLASHSHSAQLNLVSSPLAERTHDSFRLLIDFLVCSSLCVAPQRVCVCGCVCCKLTWNLNLA